MLKKKQSFRGDLSRRPSERNTKFTEKYLYWSLSLIKLQAVRNFVFKKRYQRLFLLRDFGKSFRAACLQNVYERLFLMLNHVVPACCDGANRQNTLSWAWQQPSSGEIDICFSRVFFGTIKLGICPQGCNCCINLKMT